jgi:predicted nucleic acid-binding protein
VIAVVDASVAVKWFLHGKPDEQHTDLALRVLEQSVLGFLPMVQPGHFVAEVAAVLARLKPADAQDDLLDLLDIHYRTLVSPETYATAMDLAMRYQHHLFDTLYHAVALHTPGAVLVTADQRYYNKARHEGHICLLLDFRFPGA